MGVWKLRADVHRCDRSGVGAIANARCVVFKARRLLVRVHVDERECYQHRLVDLSQDEARCRSRLGKKLRRTARRVKAENDWRREFVRANLQFDDNRRQIRRRRDLWRLTLGLRQEFADVAVVIGGNQIDIAAIPTLNVVVTIVARTALTFIRNTRGNSHAAAMVVIRRQEMQTLPQQGYTGINSQQRGTQHFADGTHR